MTDLLSDEQITAALDGLPEWARRRDALVREVEVARGDDAVLEENVRHVADAFDHHPPIYQPEVAACAVVFAADHPKRREYWVGGSTVATLVANAVAPGLLDRYLARTGYAAQQTDAHDPDKAANLWEPADGRDGRDYGPTGVFDDKAKNRSRQLWASQHHGVLIAAGAGLALGLAGLLVGRRRR